MVNWEESIIRTSILIKCAAKYLHDYILLYEGVIYISYRKKHSEVPIVRYIKYVAPHLNNEILTQ